MVEVEVYYHRSGYNLLITCQPMLKLATRYDFHELFNSDNDMSNSTNTVVYFDGKGGDLFLRFAGKVTHNLCGVGCSIFQPAKFEQTITQQHVLLRRECLIDGAAVTIILCLQCMLLIFGYIYYFQ